MYHISSNDYSTILAKLVITATIFCVRTADKRKIGPVYLNLLCAISWDLICVKTNPADVFGPFFVPFRATTNTYNYICDLNSLLLKTMSVGPLVASLSYAPELQNIEFVK